MSFTGRINAFRVIERLQRMNILGDQNIESANQLINLTRIPHCLKVYTDEYGCFCAFHLNIGKKLTYKEEGLTKPKCQHSNRLKHC